jgi:hypothetical protein
MAVETRAGRAEKSFVTNSKAAAKPLRNSGRELPPGVAEGQSRPGASLATDHKSPFDAAVADSLARAAVDASVVAAPSDKVSRSKPIDEGDPVRDSQPPGQPPSPSAALVLERLIPDCNNRDSGIWLPHAYVPGDVSARRPSAGDALDCGLPTTLATPALPAPRRLLAIADSENAITPVTATLRYVGVLKKCGALRTKRIAGLEIVHSGDFIYKHQPDYGVVRFWQELGVQIGRSGGRLVLLAGNHELEIWRSLQRGDELGLKRRQRAVVKAFIQNCQLFHVAGSVLFIHGYPTLNLLQRLRHFQTHTGLPIQAYNSKCFRPALDDPDELDNYAYLKGKGSDRFLLHDINDADSYYRCHGREISALLRYFGIEQVVHGHRPERSGVQADYEFRRWLPGIRMIGNDTQLRQRGLGAVVMRVVSGDHAEVHLVNTKSSTSDLRRQAKRALRARVASARGIVPETSVPVVPNTPGDLHCYQRPDSAAAVSAAMP